MTESPESTTVASPVTITEEAHRNNRLYRALAWVGIVAGVLFIIAVVFFSGFFAARATGGYGWHRGIQSGEVQPGGTMGGGCPMMQMKPGGMGGMGQGGMAPGGMPGGKGPGMMPGSTGSGSSTGPSASSTMTMPPPAGQR